MNHKIILLLMLSFCDDEFIAQSSGNPLIDSLQTELKLAGMIPTV